MKKGLGSECAEPRREKKRDRRRNNVYYLPPILLLLFSKKQSYPHVSLHHILLLVIPRLDGESKQLAAGSPLGGGDDRVIMSPRNTCGVIPNTKCWAGSAKRGHLINQQKKEREALQLKSD